MNSIVLEKLSQMTLLYVEDDTIAHTIIASALNKYCYTLHSAYDGEEGLMLHQRDPIDLYIIDISLPKINGLDLIRRIRQDAPKAPIIITSAHTEQEYLLDALTLSLEHYLVKPFKFEALMQVIETYIAKEFSLENIITISTDISLDLTQKQVNIKGEIVALEPKEFTCLELLSRNINKVLSYDLIEHYVYQERSMSRSAIRTLISNLNKKLRQKHIRNVSGEGYLFFIPTA